MAHRLRPGALLYATADGGWRCAVAADRFVRVHAPPAQLALLQPVLHGVATLDEAARRSADADGLRALAEAFRQQGLLDDAPAPAAPPGAVPAPAAPPGAARATAALPGAARATAALPGAPGAAGARPPTAERNGARRRGRGVVVAGDNPVAEVVAVGLAGVADVRRAPADAGALAGAPTLEGAGALVVCDGWLGDHRWREIDRLCAEAGVAWHRCHAEGAQFVVGPIALPGRPSRYADTRARRLAAAAFPDELRAYWEALESGCPLPSVPWPAPGPLHVVAGLLLTDVRAWLEGREPPGVGAQTVVDGRSAALTRHPVLPLPDLHAPTDATTDADGTPGATTDTDGTPGATPDADGTPEATPDADGTPDATPDTDSTPAGIVDARTGVIRRLETPPLPADFPPAFRLVAAVLSDARAFCPWPSDPVAAGCAFLDGAAARAAALGEAVERYCGNLPREGLRRASYTELAAAGEAAVDPDALALYPPERYAEPGFPYVPFTRDLPVRWTRGRSLPSGAPVWLPAALVWVTFVDAGVLDDEPPVAGTVPAGIATGRSRADAELRALLEVIERDALVTSWAGGLAWTAAATPTWLARLLRPSALQVRCFDVPSEAGLPVVAALARDRERGWLTLGSACRPERDAAAEKAAVEALQLQLLVRQLDDPDSGYLRRAAAGEGPLKPWRADRRYLDAYRPDLRDALDPLCNLQLYLDPALRERFRQEREARTSSAAPRPARTPPVTGRALRAPRPSRARLALLERLARLGRTAGSVEVTTSDLAGSGLHVVRVIVPGYTSNSSPAFPFARDPRRAPAGPVVAAATDLPLPH